MDDKKPIAIIAVVIIAFLGGGAWWMSRRNRPATNETPAAVAATDAPIDKPAPPVNLPPLDQRDGFLRPLLAALSSRPALAQWLATDDLIGQLASALNQAAGGATPARDFKVIAPASPFKITGRGANRAIDPSSYRRYDGLVQTVTSIDASSVAKIYRTIQPRLNEAYRGMGNPTGDVDRAVSQTLDLLIETPVVKDPVRLIEGDGAGWVYADDDLEALAPTQKQLLRMGSANVERLLVWLRALKTALETT